MHYNRLVFVYLILQVEDFPAESLFAMLLTESMIFLRSFLGISNSITVDLVNFSYSLLSNTCTEIHNTGTRMFIPDRLFLQNRLQSHLSGKELQLLESEDYNVYNLMVDLVFHELVNDGTITKEKGVTADDPEEKYHATENLDRICKDFRDSGLSV